MWSLAELKARQEAEEKEHGHDIAAIRRGERVASSHGGTMRYSAKRSKTNALASSFASASIYAAAPPARAPVLSDDPTVENVAYRGAYADNLLEAPGDGEAATIAAGQQAMQHSLAGSDTYG